MLLASLSFSLVTLFAATVLAQEIIAPEEWFESMKVAQGLVARHDKRQSSRRHRTTNGHHHHHKSNSNHKNNKVVTSSRSGLPRLAKRRWGYTSRLDIEHRATEFNSFRSDEIVAAPANLHILQEPMVGPEVTKMEMEKAGKKAGKKAVKKATKKVAGKGGNKHEKRHQKVSSSTSKNISPGARIQTARRRHHLREIDFVYVFFILPFPCICSRCRPFCFSSTSLLSLYHTHAKIDTFSIHFL
ncbi:hypothetical protein F5H01DRAFT_350010 [Linnemannia elongata]|nr:hypothetical protein F5H01DRAFT_360126 [Linnemannia elongata]KAK5809702.1 hypothetical protein F5H01DRAFT_350010 [Linnemannia elongata]